MASPSARTSPDDTSPQAREDAAAAALRAGHLAILPTESIYGVFALGSSQAAIDKLASLTPGAAERWSAAWHAPSVEAVEKVLPAQTPLHRRLLRRLAPGPVTFLFPMEEAALASLRSSTGALPGALDDGTEAAVRIIDHPLTCAVLEKVEGPVVGKRISAAGLGPDRELGNDTPAKAEELGITAILDDGPTVHGKPSTVIRLLPAGGYEIVREGAFEARTIHRRVERLILFVCTGNTCRSPMAEAIARDLVEQGLAGPIPTAIVSAGVGAGEGAPMTPEAVGALRDLGIEAPPHRSRGVTRDLISRAELIFAMTMSHADAVRAIDPRAAGRLTLLDPEGEDIPDPIGLSPEVYRQTAERLRTLILARLRELDE